MSCSRADGEGIQAFVAAKLGRCPFCMRQAFIGAVLLLVVWAFASGFLGALALIPALVFAALWIAHVVWYVWYALDDLRALHAHRGMPVTGADTFIAAFEAAWGAFYLSLPLIATSVFGLAAKTPWCNCYYDKDCSRL